MLPGKKQVYREEKCPWRYGSAGKEGNIKNPAETKRRKTHKFPPNPLDYCHHPLKKCTSLFLTEGIYELRTLSTKCPGIGKKIKPIPYKANGGSKQKMKITTLQLMNTLPTKQHTPKEMKHEKTIKQYFKLN